MSLRVVWLVLVFGCGGAQRPDEPTTAKEKQLLEAKDKDSEGRREKSWGKWRYTGDRANCIYSVKGKCFKTEKAACAAAKCKAPKSCKAVGGGPIQMQCK